jgi:hypothetical protein
MVSALIMPRSATHQAHPLDSETSAQPFGNRNQGLHVGGIARPQLAGDRTSLPVEHRADHQLLEIRALILAVAALPHAGAAFTLEVDRCGVEEHQLQLAEQVPAPREQGLLDPILGTARTKRGRALLICHRLAQPRHRVVEMM